MPVRKNWKVLGDPSIAIIGAGFGGIGMGVALRRAGFDRFTILESAQGIGGTWWHNRYPGAEVDTPSILYSYSYALWSWSRTHVKQAELQEYIEAVSDRFGVTDHIRFGVKVDRVVWDEHRQEYAVYSGDEEILRANFVVSAVGMLSDPKIPDWPGIDEFQGPIFHTSKWDDAVDLRGKRVAVIGTGSTGIQAVPQLAQICDEVTLFMREPGWIVPKNSRDLNDKEREALHNRVAQRINRFRMLAQREKPLRGAKIWRAGSKVNAAAEKHARDFINTSLASRPDLIEMVTPRHPYGGKRPIISDDFYPALLEPNVTVVPQAVAGLTESGVVDATGTERPFDAVVVATGFKVQYLSTLDVVGRGGIELHDYWGDEVRAYLGMMVPNYPNFFMMYGPNTNQGAIVTNLELQADYIAAAIKKANRKGATAVEVDPGALERYDRKVQEYMRGTTFEYESNYYKTANGRIQTQWPFSVLPYALMTKTTGRTHWIMEHRVPTAHRAAPAPQHRAPDRRRAVSRFVDSYRTQKGMNIASVLNTQSRK